MKGVDEQLVDALRAAYEQMATAPEPFSPENWSAAVKKIEAALQKVELKP